jgi:hypothetical protein
LQRRLKVEIVKTARVLAARDALTVAGSAAHESVKCA